MNLTEETTAKIIAGLLVCRNKKKSLKEKFDEASAKIKELEAQLESEMLRRKEAEGIDKFTSEDATVFWSNLRSVKIEDWAAFNKLATLHPDLVTRTLVKSAALELLDSGVPLDGCKVSGIQQINLRAKKKADDSES